VRGRCSGRKESWSDGTGGECENRRANDGGWKSMSFFREYLRENNVLHDPRLDETDEDFLVQALLQAWMNKSNTNIVIRAGFFGKRDLERELKTPKAQEALQFVAAFLGYTAKVPITYGREIESFKIYITPGFATDASKHEQLRRGLRAAYFDATLESLETTETLDALFDIAELKAVPARE
jgi:hypothetical protein